MRHANHSADATILGNELAEDAKLASKTVAGEAIEAMLVGVLLVRA
jgi:hypothetical protein